MSDTLYNNTYHALFNCYCFSWVDQYPLHSAAYEGNADKVRHLLSMGYPADQPDMHSWVPLHYASWLVQMFYFHSVIKKINKKKQVISSALHPLLCYSTWPQHTLQMFADHCGPK